MPICTKKKRPNRQICIGDLDKLITIKTRDMKGKGRGSLTLEEIFVDFASPYALIETKKGREFFDGTNVVRSPDTHIFTIRFLTGLTQEMFIFFEDRIFDIVNVEDLEERHQFMECRCVERGSKLIKVNEG